jgi:hypothetical protein
LQEHGEHEQGITILMLMHEMTFHRLWLTIDLMLARAVEMKLQEVKGVTVEGEGTAWGVVNLDGMAGVDYLDGRRSIVDFRWDKAGRRGIHQVDRRLVLSTGAGGIVGTEFAPMFRRDRSGIAPPTAIAIGG